MNQTLNPDLTSWVESANEDSCDFPIQNLPFGVFSRGASAKRIGVAIGDRVLDLAGAAEAGLLGSLDERGRAACASGRLNEWMALGAAPLSALRGRLSAALGDGATSGEKASWEKCLVPMDAVTMHLPAEVGDYTDFYASVYHATNVGSMFRPDNPLLPNYKHIPIAYHGRVSSLVPTGTPVRRPAGQTRPSDEEPPRFGPTRLLDYELEVGVFVGEGNPVGEPIAIDDAPNHVFGLCLVNDWSARDIQKWEYQPLGPFLAKSFATTLSPWVVTLEALEPFRSQAFARPDDDPEPLPYLIGQSDQRTGGIDLTLEVYLESEAMRRDGIAPHRVSRGSFLHMYWTVFQMLSHHSSNGCNLRPGDLMASGTVSGPEENSRGCLLEMTWRGKNPVSLPDGSQRKFLLDGDRVVIRGFCERDGARRIGMGECSGTIIG